MTPQEEIQQLKERISKLEQTVNYFTRADRFVFDKPLMGEIRGLKLGQTGGKLGFFGAEPTTQYSTALNSTAGASYGSNEQNIINAIRAGLIQYGLFHS